MLQVRVSKLINISSLKIQLETQIVLLCSLGLSKISSQFILKNLNVIHKSRIVFITPHNILINKYMKALKY